MDQKQYWNGDAGALWVEENAALDAMLAPLGAAAIAALAPMAGERILDVGCGAGATSRALAAAVGPEGAVTGIDISAHLVDLALQADSPVTFVCGDASADPFPGAPFDAAFSRFGVMFFERPAEAFAHIGAAMQPGGRLAFVCWRAMAENAWARETMRVGAPLLPEPPPAVDPHAPGPFAFADANRVRAILEEAGWGDVAVTPLDTDYVLGVDAGTTAQKMLRIGPLGRMVMQQNADPAPILAALETLLRDYQTPAGVAMPAACWIVTARR